MYDEIPKHRKKGGQKKPFLLERRYIGSRNIVHVMFSCLYNREWHLYSAYKTKRARQDAINRLQSKSATFEHDKWEYRIPDE